MQITSSYLLIGFLLKVTVVKNKRDSIKCIPVIIAILSTSDRRKTQFLTIGRAVSLALWRRYYVIETMINNNDRQAKTKAFKGNAAKKGHSVGEMDLKDEWVTNLFKRDLYSETDPNMRDESAW